MADKTKANKIIGKLKNAVIVVLLFACVYQTFKLWFGDVPIHNFFSSFAAKEISYNEEEVLAKLADPECLIVSYDVNKFAIFQSEKDDKIEIISDAISKTLKKGEFVESYKMTDDSLVKLLNKKMFVYDFSFGMPSDVYAKIMQVKAGTLTNKFRKFNKLFIVPGASGNDSLSLFFLDTETLIINHYSMKKQTANTALNEMIDNVKSSNSELFYVSTLLKGYTKDTNIFVPELSGDYTYNTVTMRNPYYENQEIVANDIEKYMHPFFPNPEKVIRDTIDGVYSFTDGDIVVKYYSNNVLEYLNFYVFDPNEKAQFLPALTAAVSFIERDNTISNYVYLTDYSYNDLNNSYTFCFDFAINQNPIFLSNTISEGNEDLKHMVEVTVAPNNKVIKYKRFVAAFEIDELNTVTIQNGFINTMDNLYDIASIEDDDENKIFDNIYFGYKIGSTSSLRLNWIIEYDGRLIAEPAR